MEKDSKIYVAGHAGFVGSAIVRELRREGYENLVYRDSCELDLLYEEDTQKFFSAEQPEYVFMAAARAGGIKGIMDHPAEFIYENSEMQNNVIESCYRYSVKKMLFLGSSCVYPEHGEQPYKEESILTGTLEKSIEPYAIAKILGIKTCEMYNRQYGTNFVTIIPPNLYGPRDNFDSEDFHFVPALIKRFHDAKLNNLHSVVLWGSGEQRREVVYVDDAANACLFVMKNYNSSDPINVGIGKDYSIKEIGEKLKEIVCFKGNLEFDRTKPEGAKRKLIDSAKINSLGWSPQVDLEEGLRRAYGWFLES
jgi:GDP-L-fucose synthase